MTPEFCQICSRIGASAEGGVKFLASGLRWSGHCASVEPFLDCSYLTWIQLFFRHLECPHRSKAFFNSLSQEQTQADCVATIGPTVNSASRPRRPRRRVPKTWGGRSSLFPRSPSWPSSSDARPRSARCPSGTQRIEPKGIPECLGKTSAYRVTSRLNGNPE